MRNELSLPDTTRNSSMPISLLPAKVVDTTPDLEAASFRRRLDYTIENQEQTESPPTPEGRIRRRGPLTI